ncbi:hypothetical protein JXR93_13150 [bacterium]|nr:hypothetical protein [bacterium]
MRELILSIASNDGETIPKIHTGDSKEFYIYKIFENGDFTLIKKIENTLINADETHGGAGKMRAILELLKDCSIIIGGAISPNFKNMAKKTEFQPVVIKTDDINEAIKKIVNSFDLLYQLVQNRKDGLRDEDIPTLF